MENYLCNIFWISLATGLLGGTINFLFLDVQDKDWYKDLFKSLVVGIGASFVVPLFLQTISSDLINQCKQDSKYYFVYAGFCIVAAIFSKRFLKTVGDNVLKEAKDANRKAEEAISTAKENEEKVSVIVAQNTEPNQEVSSSKIDIKAIENDVKEKVKGDVDNVINALKSSKYAYRTAKGLAKEVNSDVKVITQILEELEKHDVVKHFDSSNRESVVWALTDLGHRMFNKENEKPGA
ncbi:MAG: hypothetical protein L6Q77_07245 [Bacteroidetes bacterium]|nr:hypothetical protein [Bacteroidota bacterium]